MSELEKSVSKVTSLQSVSDLKHWAGNWIWRAVQCLVESPEFSSSPKWIAQRLNITVEKAVDAIEGLERLGMIKKTASGFAVVDSWIQNTPEEMEPFDLLAQHAKIAPQIITKLTESDKFTSQFFLGNKDLIGKYSRRFIALFKEMNDEGIQQGCSEVIASEISFVQLTQDSGQEGAQ